MTITSRAILFVGWMALPSAAEEPPTPSVQVELDAGLKLELEELAQRLDGIRDFTTDFREEKFSSLLKKPLVSKGKMRVVGVRSRWDTISPKPSAMLVDPTEIHIYYPDRSTVEVYQVDEKLKWLTFWPLPRISILVDRFFIERVPVAELDDSNPGGSWLGLRLRPRDEGIRDYLHQVEVVFNTTTGFVFRVEILDADGDRTVISFSNTHPNTGLGDKDIELVVPAGTQVVRPLAKLEK